MAGARARARGEAARAIILQFFSPACVAGLFLCEQAVELAGGLRVDAGSDARAQPGRSRIRPRRIRPRTDCLAWMCRLTFVALRLAYAQAQAGGQDPREPKPFTAQRSCRRR
jgi:hypothetical protein